MGVSALRILALLAPIASFAARSANAGELAPQATVEGRCVEAFCREHGKVPCDHVHGTVVPIAEPRSDRVRAPAPSRPTVDGLLTYTLGMSYDVIKKWPTYHDEPARDHRGLKAGKLIGLFGEHSTVQDVFFREGKLVKFSVIYDGVKVDAEAAKSIVARTWGDPGSRDDSLYTRGYNWTGTVGSIVISGRVIGSHESQRTQIVVWLNELDDEDDL